MLLFQAQGRFTLAEFGYGWVNEFETYRVIFIGAEEYTEINFNSKLFKDNPLIPISDKTADIKSWLLPVFFSKERFSDFISNV